jgi:hypothetical protein
VYRSDSVEIRHCSGCGDERVFEQPPCADGHGADCPERACTECGGALLIGLPEPCEVRVAGRTARAA